MCENTVRGYCEEVGANNELDNLLNHIVINKVNNEINTYNKTLVESDNYKKRSLEIVHEDAICVSLNQAIEAIEKVTDNDQSIWRLKDILNSQLKKLLNQEMPKVIILECWEREKELKAKILTLDISDYETTVTTLVTWYKNLCGLDI